MTTGSRDQSHRPKVVLVRHGETAWTISGQHTGRTDVPLTDNGRRQATQLAPRLAQYRFSLVLASPLSRAMQTCRLAGWGDGAESSDDVVEWDYGAYDGRTTADIRQENPSWSLWSDGVPGGDTPAEVGTRADRVISRLRAVDGEAAVFSHGHFLRVLAARWLDLPPSEGRLVALGPASVSVLDWEREQPVIRLWNDVVAD